MQNPVGWFEIYVDDLDRAVTFYQSIFGVELDTLTDPSATDVIMKAFPANYEAYGASGALVKMNGVPAGNNSTLVYFSCEDCAVEEAKVESAGGKVEKSKFSIGDYGFITLAIDTEGNMFGLHSQQ